MPPDNWTVSAIITTYNSERYVAEALDSVLAQTRPPFEILVVDDGSTDSTETVVRGHGSQVRWFQQAHAGVGAARNFIVRQARGNLLAFLDGDDLWLPDKLEKQLAALEADPRPDVVFGHALQMLSPELDPQLRARLWSPEHPVPARTASTMLITPEAFDRVGPFETDLRITEFINWYGRMVDSGLRIVMLPDLLVRRRIHGSNTSMRHQAMMIEYPRVLKRMLDQRRSRQP